MNLTMLIIDSLLLLGIVCVSLYGASALPPGAKVPIHFGPASAWPVPGGVVALIIR
jgi:hypothetical protein